MLVGRITLTNSVLSAILVLLGGGSEAVQG